MNKNKASSRVGRVSVGHPVDVAFGILFHDFDDLQLPGRMPLVFSRRYSSALLDKGGGLFGSGWSSPFEMMLVEDLEGYRMLDEDGETEVTFDDPQCLVASGGVVRNPSAFCEIRQQEKSYIVTRWDPESDHILIYLFSSVGQESAWSLRGIRDQEGQGIDIFRDERSRIRSITQRREGRGLHLVYNNNDQGDRLSEVYIVTPTASIKTKDKNEQQKRLALRYYYNQTGLLSKMIDLTGGQSSYEYLEEGHLVREKSISGMTYEFRYDNEGRCIETTGENNFGRIQLEFYPEARITTVTDCLDKITTFELNANGQVIREISPLGNVTSMTYDSYGRIEKIEVPSGAETSYMA